MRVSRNVSTAHSRPPRPKVTTVTKFYGACVCLFFCLCVLGICTGNLAVAKTDIKMHWGFKHPVLLVWPRGSWVSEFYKAKLWSMCIFPRWMKCWGKCPANDSLSFLHSSGMRSDPVFLCLLLFTCSACIHVYCCFHFSTKVWQVHNSCFCGICVFVSLTHGGRVCFRGLWYESVHTELNLAVLFVLSLKLFVVELRHVYLLTVYIFLAVCILSKMV